MISGGSRGGARGTRASALLLYQTEARGAKKTFLETAEDPLSCENCVKESVLPFLRLRFIPFINITINGFQRKSKMLNRLNLLPAISERDGKS